MEQLPRCRLALSCFVAAARLPKIHGIRTRKDHDAEGEILSFMYINIIKDSKDEAE